MNVFNEIESSIKKAKKILIISHINPDGDTLGSMCAMAGIIRLNYKKNPDILLDNLPKTYDFLINIKEAKTFENIDKSLVYDLVITIDVADLGRIDSVKVLFEKAINTINIDHHGTNPDFAKINLVKAEYSSTGEVITELAQNLNWKLNDQISEALYTAILTDTGAFRYSNTSPKTFKTVANLLEYGLKPSEIYEKCYESYPKDFFMFQNYCLNKAKFCNDDKLAYMEVYQKDVEKFAVGKDCTEGLTEKLRAISTTEIAFLAKEIGYNLTKFSMRSKSIDVAEICSKFGGGGHKLAAGCVIELPVKKAVERMLGEIKKINL